MRMILHLKVSMGVGNVPNLHTYSYSYPIPVTTLTTLTLIFIFRLLNYRTTLLGRVEAFEPHNRTPPRMVNSKVMRMGGSDDWDWTGASVKLT